MSNHPQPRIARGIAWSAAVTLTAGAMASSPGVAEGEAVARMVRTAQGNCGGVRPAVLAAVERGGVRHTEWPELTNCRQRVRTTV